MDETKTTDFIMPNPERFQPRKGGVGAFLAIALLVVLGAGAAGYYWNSKQKAGPLQPQNQEEQQGQNQVDGDANPSQSQSEPTVKEPLVSGLIAWKYPQQSFAELLKKVDPGEGNVSYFDPISEAKYYDLGTFKSGKYVNAKVLLLKAAYEGPGAPLTFFFAQSGQNGDKFTLLQKYSDSMKDYPYLDQSKFSVDKDITIKDMEFPDAITGPKGQSMIREKAIAFTSAYETFNATGLKFVYNDPKVGAVYTTPDNKDAVAGIYQQYGFYVKAPDYRVLVYKYNPPFVDSKGVPKVTWTDGKTNTTAYAWTERYGCGSNFSAVTTGLDLAKDLTPAGKTAGTNETVYELKDKNSKLYKELYDGVYFPEGQQKPTLAQFIAKRPMFFWVDPFGRLLKFTNSDFGPMAECGKPVIYLYPTKTTDVSVRLDPRGGFSYTEPVYSEGWDVTATPNGVITNKADGKTYPYLFWEGRGGYYKMPDEGFVVSQKELHSFLVGKLNKLGLNSQETADFIEFWEPKMQGSPYYFVTFMGSQVMDSIAPLQVTPSPDTVIRVLMDYQPLEKPIQVQGFDIKTPERKGFTVVEWGGVLK